MRLRNILFICIGFASIGIGVIGIILPVLPTTPFIILSSYCFVKGSNRFDAWFKDTKIYKNYAQDFVQSKSMTLKRKLKILLVADVMIAIPMITINNIYVRVGLLLIVIIKYYYFIFKIKTQNK